MPTEPGGAFTPKAPTTVFGLQVAQVIPGSVGMALGFSIVVNANFAKARKVFEMQLGHAMKCEPGDDMQTCEFQIGDKKTAVLMSEGNGKAKTSLIGCYYFYEK